MNIERPLIAWDRCASALLLQKNYLPHFHHWLRWSRLERGPQKSQKARGETVRYLVQIRQGNRFLLSNFWQNPLELFLHDRICLPRIPSAASNKYEVSSYERETWQPGFSWGVRLSGTTRGLLLFTAWIILSWITLHQLCLCLLQPHLLN